MTTSWEAWTYRTSAARTPEASSIAGYEVHAIDGHIGKIDESSDEVGASRVVVDTGPWIFGRKVVLPAGVIERVDDAAQKVYVDLTKAEIRDAPDLDEGGTFDDTYRDRLTGYYGGLGRYAGLHHP